VVALGEADGMPPPTYPGPTLSWARVVTISEACRGAGRRAPAVCLLSLASGSVRGANLRSSA